MVYITINGEKKKVACGPCIRGHRSTKCEHKDRLLLEVRKPGRPLSGCPHPAGSCSCERVVINYTIPKSSECACPSSSSEPASATASVSSVAPTPSAPNRVQKSKRKKSISTRTNAAIEKAIEATENAEKVSNHHPKPAMSRPGSSSSDGASASSSTSSLTVLPSRAQDSGRVPDASNGDVKKEDEPKLRLGMMGVGGYRAAPDEIGWNGEWPDIHNTEKHTEPNHEQLAVKSCCSGGQKIAPKPQPGLASCCSSDKMPSSSSRDQHAPHQTDDHANGDNVQKKPAMQFQMPLLDQRLDGFNPGHNWPQPSAALHSVVAFPTTLESGPNQYDLSFMSADGTHQNINGGPMHNCHCGDNCSCLGCAAHPRNEATVNYIREMNELMMHLPPNSPTRGVYGSMGGRHEQPSFLNTNQQTRPYVAQAFPQQFEPFSASTVSGADMTNLGFSQSNSHFMNDMSSMTWPSMQLPPSNSLVDEPPLSPSSFFLQQLVLPGCSDASGTCQCGDGCTCVGCLTHGGHNGMPLEMPSESMEQTGSGEFG